MNDIVAIFSNSIGILYIGFSFLVALLCLVNAHSINKSGNRWLGIFMCCIFLYTLPEMLIIAGMKEYTILIGVLDFTAFIFAPAFYFTVSYFINPDRSWKIKDYFHLFLLALLYLLVLTYAIIYLDALQGERVPAVLLMSHIFTVLYCIQIFYYCTLSWIKLRKHQKNIRLFNSTIENVDLKWLQYMVVCVLITACFFIIHSLNNLSYYYLNIIRLSYLISFFFIAYFFIRQKEIYPFTADQKNEIINTIIKETSKIQPPKKLIEDNRMEELKTALLRIMENEKPFLDCELTLAKLGNIMDISLHQLSYLINTGFNENFYQFINRYRIEEAKKLILDENTNYLSFQEIAFEVGFNSKSAFNVTFKKSIGQTPSEYKAINLHKELLNKRRNI
ncbi:MAG TPA: helix-turn-helix domain-containing protein [Flavobacterium sp.]|jgi:AraC-like DNA-binding protein